MKMMFNQTLEKDKFYHPRSDTQILVEKVNEGALVSFVDYKEDVASILIASESDLDCFTSIVQKVDNYGFGEVVGASYENIVLNAYITNWGEPFEEAVEFSFSLAESEKPYSEETICACIEQYQLKRLLEAIKAKIR